MGRLIGHAAVDNMARFTLELGGKSPLIVLDDADPAAAAQGAANGIFFHQGQVCTAGSRVYVQRGIFDKVVSQLALVAEGATLVTGGGRAFDGGCFVKPTVFVDAKPSMRIVREEVFGPVATVVPFDDVEDAIRLANDSAYGLAASVWSNNLSAVHRIVPRLQAGVVWVNAHNVLDNALPLGGVKQSGYGRDLGRAAVESFTELKSVCMAV